MWSSNGISTWIEQALNTSQGLLLTVNCSTNHLTIFGVFDETILSPVTPAKSIYPISSIYRSTSNSSIVPRVQDNTATIIIAATVVPVVSIIIIVAIVFAVLLIIFFLRRRKQKYSVKKEPEIELGFEDVRHE